MASSSPNNSSNPTHSPNGFDPSSLPNTTFVQADPATFRAIVQRLTGAASVSGEACTPFKLQERRPTTRKLAIKLNHTGAAATPRSHYLSSPVSPLDYAAARGSPRSPTEEEEKAIAQKGFYLHPSPRGSDPPELLPLFPLHSPREN